MAFSSSRLAIKQVTFEADDQRCNQQNVSSLQDLVNFDCEFPQQESLSFYKLFKKREKCQSGLNEDSENIQNFDEFILKSETSRSNIDESFKNHVSKELSKNLIQPMLKISNNDNNLNEDKVNNFFKMNSTTNESILNDSSKNTDQASIDIERVLKHAEEILRNAHIEEHTSHSPQPSNSSKARPTKDSTPHSKTHKKQISWLSRTNSQSSLVTNDEHSDKIGYAYSNTSYLNSEISRLREENELLIIKINKLKYEIRSKDQVADDLKQKIAQMHIELESTCLSKTQFLTDIESLRNDLNRLNGEKSGLYQNMKELLYENDQLQEKLKLEYKKSNEQASLIDRLQTENNALSKESIDVKMRCLKEKEDLVRNLEQIETDIIRREQNMFTQKYEKILIESCETIKKNEAKKYNDMLKQEADNIRKDFESKLNDFIKTSEKRTNQIHETSDQEKIEKNFIENLEKFQNENKKLEYKINQYEAEIEYLKKNLQVEKEKSEAKSNELILINKQKFKVMAQVKQALKEKEENERLRKEILQLKNKLNTYEDQVNEIEIKKEKELNTQINQRKDYDDKIIELEQKNEKLENELNILDTFKLQSECDIIALKNEMDSKDEEISSLNEEIQKIRTVLQMTESSQDLEDKKFRLAEKIKQFEQDILNEQEINEKLNLNLVEWNNANQILEQEILNNQELNQKLNEQLASDQINISSLQQCYENLKIDEKETSKNINELETKRLELKLKIESLEAEIIDFQELNTKLVDNLQQWQQANKILEDQIIEAQQQNSDFVNQSNDLIEKSKLNEEKSLIQEFIGESECFTDQNKDLNLMHNEKKFESLIDQNTQTVHNTSDDFENSIITTKYKLEETETNIELIEGEILRNQELYSNLMENLVEWENANRVLEKQIIDLQTQNNELALSHQSFEPKFLFDEEISKLKLEYEEQLNSKEMKIEDLLYKISKFEKNSISNVTNDSNLIDQVSAKDNLDYTLNSENNDEISASIIDSVTIVKNEDDKIKLPSDEKQNFLNEEQKKELYSQLESKNRLIEQLNKAIDQYSNLNKMSERIEDLETCKNKTNELENEIKIIQNKISESEELNEQLKKNLTEWNNANETLEAKILEYQRENMGLTLRLDDQIAKINEGIIKNISDKYNKEIEDLKKEFDRQHQINDETDLLKEVIELKDQKLNDLNAMLEQYRANDNLIDNINALEHKRSELDSQVLNIQQEISNLEASILEKQNLSSQLSQNLIEWQNSNQLLEDQIISFQQQNSKLLNQQSLETINQHNLDKINSLERINQELLESNEKYKEEIIKWEVREQEIRCKIDESERVRQELQIQNMDLLCDVDSLRSEKEVLENERKELAVNDSSNSELTNTITNDSYCSQDSAKVKDLEAIIDDLKKEMSKKDEQFQISIKVLELEIEHRLNEHNLLISNFESLQSSQQQLQNKNTDLLGQIDTLNLQNQSLQTDLTGLKEMENRCNNLIKNVQDLNSQILLKDQELLNAKDQNSHLLSELDLIKVKKEEIEFLYNKSVSDQCELRDLNTEIDILKSQLESKSLDITEFKNRINFADQQHEKMTKFFEKKITDLNAKIDSKDDLINILQSEINTLKSNEKFNKTGNLAYGENISSSDPGTQINILNNIVQNQKLLIDKLEKESKKMCFLYEKLIYAQSRLISKQGQCYNDALHSLINSFQDLDPSQIDHKVQEIESDLNNLIHLLNNIKDNDLENAPSDTLGSPYSLQSLRQFISQHSSPVKVSDFVNSLTDELEINSHQDGTFQEENLKHKNSTSLLLMVKKCDAETQCDINYIKDDHTGSLRLSTDFNEINNLQDLIANYLNLIKSYKSLLAKLDAVSVDNSELREAYSFLNDEFLKLKKSNSKNQISKEVNGHRTSDLSENEKIHNLKSAYENLYSLYQHHKTESIKSYNRVHNAYIQLINSSKNNFYPKTDYLQTQPTIAHNAPKMALQNQEIPCSANVNLKSEIDKLDSRLQAEELKNQVLKQKLNDYEIQIELSNSKINALGGQIELKENEFKALKSKIDQIETAKDNTINKLTKNSNSLAEECELLKNQLSSLKREKIDLESTVEDLKRTLKLTEKESQYNLKLDLMHIRAKLLTPSNEELAIGADGKPLRAILPPVSETSSIKSSSSLNSIDKSDILNDYAIDITHIEKMVQDSDSIILEKKPLDGVQSCLKSLRDQMTELQTQVYEQARESSTWRYKLGFTCEKCEMKWEIEHQVRDSKQKLDADDEFLESSVTQQIPKCNCAKLNEKHEADSN